MLFYNKNTHEVNYNMQQDKTFFVQIITFIFSILFMGSFAAKAEIKVVTTIKPLHSLISNVMDGIGEPSLIIEGTTSPHSFVLKPSHAKLIEQANIIFWIGKDIETFMEKPLSSIAKNSKKISFMELKNIDKLKFREENIFEHDDHDGHGHDEDKDHDGHGHDEDKDHDGHGHEGHHHGEYDAHIWLDPFNAKEMIHEIAHELSGLDPANADKYNQNADKTILAINKMVKKINENINKNAKFIVFHDAYQYFEKRFGISTAGALTLNTDVLPGAKQISEIHEVISSKEIKCIFSEPQFNPKIIETIAKDTGIKTGVLDPLGSTFDANKSQYFKLINDLGNKLNDC